MFEVTDEFGGTRHVCRCHLSSCPSEEIASAVPDPDFRGDCEECASAWSYGYSPNCTC